MAPPGEATAHAPRRSGRDGERVEANDLFLLRREERGPALPYPTRSAPPQPTLGEERVRSAATHLPNFPQPARALRPPARPHPASSRRQPMVEIPPESAIGLQAREGGEKFEERAMLIGRRVGGTA